MKTDWLVRGLIALLLLTVSIGLWGCNTVSGVGKDLMGLSSAVKQGLVEN